MANANKKRRGRRSYTKRYCVGFRVELPNKFITPKSIAQIKKNKNILFVDCCVCGKIVPKHIRDLLLAKSEEEPDGRLTNFSILVDVGPNLKEVERVVKIINILGDDKLVKEKVQLFMSGSSLLSSIPELKGLRVAFESLEQVIPRFSEVAWYSAPDAKLR